MFKFEFMQGDPLADSMTLRHARRSVRAFNYRKRNGLSFADLSRQMAVCVRETPESEVLERYERLKTESVDVEN